MNLKPLNLWRTPGSPLLALLIVAYWVVGALYAVYTPLWQAPDEPAHFNYVKYLAEQRRLPVLRQGDYPAAYLEEIKSRRFPPDMPIEPIRYEFWQPPLYYSLAVIIYRVTTSWSLSAQVMALRLFSVLLGAGVLWLAYRTAREIFPRTRPSPPASLLANTRFAPTEGEGGWLALGAAAFVTAVPMHVAMTAAINNDTLAELILCGILYLCLKVAKGETEARRLLGLGVLIGLGLLTKATAGVSVVLALAGLWLGLRRLATQGKKPPSPWQALLLIFAPALLISGWWFLRNAFVYGFDDPLIWKRHAQVVAGQLTTAQYLAQHGWRGWFSDFLRTTFHSFWGQFGWMAVPMDGRIYLLLGLLCGLVGVGLVLFVLRQWCYSRASSPPTPLPKGEGSPRSLDVLSGDQVRSLLLVALLLGLMVAVYLWYNRQLVQFQGRYLFPAIVPLGLFFALGLSEILRRGCEKWLAGLLGVGALLWLAKGLLTGGLNKLLIVLLAASALGLAVKKALPARYDRLLVALVYLALLALVAVAPFRFIAPYL